MKTFYKPTQGDTAAVVADGYDNNFQSLDAAKADAAATAAALAEKVDKVEGQSLMTSEERAKLAGIEEGANAYVLPQASAETLGGIKVGNNLIMREDGTLDAPYAGGLDPESLSPVAQISSSDRLLAFSPSGEPQTATAAQVSDYVQAQTNYIGENLLLESRGPWVRHSMGDLRVYPFSTGFLTQGETYVFSYVDECAAPAFATFHLLTRNGPDIIQQIQPGVPFVATRTDWEYILVRKGNEGGICTVSRLKLERGTKVTPWACAPAEAGPLLPTLDEQPVPGEFWMGVDGVTRQVYQRTFRGTFATTSETLLTGIDAVQVVQGYMIQETIHHMPFESVLPFADISTATRYLAHIYVTNQSIVVHFSNDGVVPGSPYVVTLKYTKA